MISVGSGLIVWSGCTSVLLIIPLLSTRNLAGIGSSPGIIAIESLEIDAETRVQLLEFFRQGEVKTEFISIFVILIRKYRKSESMLFHDLFCILVQLGGGPVFPSESVLIRYQSSQTS